MVHSATPSTPVSAAVPSLVSTPSSLSLDGSTKSTVDFLLPIPAKLAQAIKDGKFVDFGDLLHEALREHAFKTVSSRKDY